ncbi:hypothetical protein FA95DRAFT_1611133 [Auriscalpium vulgare]|uniref:Uncharacterized protein n=1 Tax=Auriscalpium vulgare TaxID=40419 RepID=A0ACB8RB73_9AGAM|nr:hypothetical protein FA95DRAFT_1611133 [Auriscalpium vulgare]
MSREDQPQTDATSPLGLTGHWNLWTVSLATRHLACKASLPRLFPSLPHTNNTQTPFIVFAPFSNAVAVQLLKLGGPSDPIHQHFLDRLTLGGHPRIIAIVDLLPFSSSWEIVDIVKSSSAHARSPVEMAPAALNLQPCGHRRLESSVLDHEQFYATSLVGVLVVILVSVLVLVAATCARGHALIKAHVAGLQKSKLARAQLAQLQGARVADAQLADSQIRSLRNDDNTLAQRTCEQESLIRQMTTQAAREDADHHSRLVEQLNAAVDEDARIREDELCATIRARNEQLRDAQNATDVGEQQSAQLEPCLQMPNPAPPGLGATISILRLASDVLQTELASRRSQAAAAEDVEELDTLLISEWARNDSAQWVVAELSDAVKDLVHDLDLVADVQPVRTPQCWSSMLQAPPPTAISFPHRHSPASSVTNISAEICESPANEQMDS